MKLFLLLLSCFLLIISCKAQNATQYHFVEFSTIYQSGLVDKSGDLILLKRKENQAPFSFEKYCFALGKQKLASYNEVLDTLCNSFELYAVRFSKDSSGTTTKKLLDQRSSFEKEYLIKMDQTRNTGPVNALLIKVFSLEIATVKYKVLHAVCPYYKDECVAEVSEITLKNIR
ncbi:hypothetical protein LK994_13825 [Ferruginibacter lapsinanis]|uniref:hypothetical protein n=1 Tax=Ferruginibacter lapsinanis TaxID=563172 RepID=UPI001E32C9BF|nr:hypothetical protein [Ferruginibacter lapsinanis]UEG49716.1 hypothetical protein LK994_13825 [Ferruginibacter lapsinanis]